MKRSLIALALAGLLANAAFADPTSWSWGVTATPHGSQGGIAIFWPVEAAAGAAA